MLDKDQVTPMGSQFKFVLFFFLLLGFTVADAIACPAKPPFFPVHISPVSFDEYTKTRCALSLKSAPFTALSSLPFSSQTDVFLSQAYGHDHLELDGLWESAGLSSLPSLDLPPIPDHCIRSQKPLFSFNTIPRIFLTLAGARIATGSSVMSKSQFFLFLLLLQSFPSSYPAFRSLFPAFLFLISRSPRFFLN